MLQLPLELDATPSVTLETQSRCLPHQAAFYPEFRYMGSKHKLLPWIHGVLDVIDFESAADPFFGAGSVSYLMKSMGRRVVATDFLSFSATIAQSLIENNNRTVDTKLLNRLISGSSDKFHFIEKTFSGIFFTKTDLRFLDAVWSNLSEIEDRRIRAVVLTALIRSCLKRQPRGVFTVSGNLSHYDDGRRDLRLTLKEHFIEQLEVVNRAVFTNNRRNYSAVSDVFDAPSRGFDLVYLDPPYVPRSDDNCYVKRYHFIEGLSNYWIGQNIDFTTKVRKIAKKYTPFSYRKTAIDAFDAMFFRYRKQKIVLSYSSNGYPDLDVLMAQMRRYKSRVEVHVRPHRYHFGTHGKAKRTTVNEYLIVGI